MADRLFGLSLCQSETLMRQKRLTVCRVHELVALQGTLGFELLPAQVAEVSLFCAVPVQVSLEVAFAAGGVVTERAFEGLHSCMQELARVYCYLQ